MWTNAERFSSQRNKSHQEFKMQGGNHLWLKRGYIFFFSVYYDVHFLVRERGGAVGWVGRSHSALKLIKKCNFMKLHKLPLNVKNEPFWKNDIISKSHVDSRAVHTHILLHLFSHFKSNLGRSGVPTLQLEGSHKRSSWGLHFLSLWVDQISGQDNIKIITTFVVCHCVLLLFCIVTYYLLLHKWWWVQPV